MDDLLAMFGLGRAITLTVAMGASIAALFTAPIDAQSPAAVGQVAAPAQHAALPPDASGEHI